jgi:hypothetical protein
MCFALSYYYHIYSIRNLKINLMFVEYILDVFLQPNPIVALYHGLYNTSILNATTDCKPALPQRPSLKEKM